MQKRINMIALIVLLIFQTVIAPIAATAQEIAQDDTNVTISEKLNVTDEVDSASENEQSAEAKETGGVDEDKENEPVSQDNPKDEVTKEDSESRENEVNADTEKASAEEKQNGDTADTPSAEAQEVTEDSTTNEEVVTEEKAEDDVAEEAVTEKTEEDTEDASEEAKLETQAIAPLASKDLGNIFVFESLTHNDEEITDGDIIDFSDGSAVQVKYSWHTEDLNAKAGDTTSFMLPNVFKQVNVQNQPIITSGITVGTYSIIDGKLEFVFNEEIESDNVNDGYAILNLEFDLEKFREDVEQKIKFNDKEDKTLTVIAKPSREVSGIEKEGHPDRQQDAREINWSIDIINNNDEPISDTVLRDTLPEGLGKPGNFVIREISVGINGEKTLGSEVEVSSSVVSNEFELNLGEISPYKGYRVEYKTTIEDYTIESFKNNALFTYEDTELPADATVDASNRSNPIEKKGNYNKETGQIEWEIIVNQSGGEIDEAIVYDTLPEELIFDADSLEVIKYNDNWGWLENITLDTNEFPVNLGKVEANEIYQIKFKTDIDWSEVNGGKYTQDNSFTNETELKDGKNPRGKDNATVNVKRESLLSKSGNASDYNYKDKVLTWTLDVNKAKHPISNAVITDILPVGLDITERDIVIKNEAGEDVAAESIEINVLDDRRTEVKIELGDIGTETLKVTYKTEVEDFEENNFKNEATLDGNDIGEDTPKDDATVHPPGNSFNKDFKGIDYSEKTMDWTITVDPNREAIAELEIKDTFPNNGMILLPDTVVVKVGGTELEKNKYTLVENTTDGETGYNKGFTIKFNNISEDSPLNERLTVDFKTSYDPQLEVEGNTADDHTGDSTLYTNHADFTGKTVNDHVIDEEDDASTNVRIDSWNSGKKEGQLVHEDTEDNLVNGWVSGSERKIAWQLYTNYQEQNLGKGVVITDTLDYEGTIDEDSVVVKTYNVDVNGETNITDNILDKENYVVEYTGDTFTLEFVEGFKVTERYVIEFTTTVPDISQPNYINNATVKVGEDEYDYKGTVNYDKHDNLLDKKALELENNNVYTGDEIDWEIKVNEGLSVIKEATIVDTISKGLVYVDNSLEIVRLEGTNEVPLVLKVDYSLDVQVDEASGETALTISLSEDLEHTLLLKYSTVVTETNGSVNNKVELKGTGIEKVQKESDRLNARQFSDVGGNFNQNRGAIRVNKVDENGETIKTGEATFELYYELNGKREQFIQEDAFVTQDGILEIGNLPLRTYYLQEIKSPDGYIISGEEITIDVTESLKDKDGPYEVEFKNIAELKIPVTKIWNDADNQDGLRLPSITVNLLANGEFVNTAELTQNDNWSTTFTGLSPVDENGEAIEYTVEEVSVEGYETSIDGSVADDGFIITNTHEPELIDLEGTKTWDDADDQDGKRPDSITVRLLAGDTEVASKEVTADDEWKYEFTNLPKYANGTEIAYTVQEDGVTDYSTTIENYNITNSYTPGKTSINVVKNWDDTNNQDGIRPTEITVKLLADGDETDQVVVLNEDNSWQADFTDLDVNKAGEPIVYTVEEVAVEGYETSIAGTAEDGFIITNTHEPELVNIEGTKTWDDAENQDGKRPDLITVRLLVDGEEVESVEITADDEWKYVFTDLPKYASGEEITYTIQENGVEEYSTEIDGFNIKNSYTPGKTSINVVKNWDDTNNQDGIRPTEITVKLLADGEETDQVVVLKEDNNWQADFTELDVNKAGEPIVYTVEEFAVEGYETSIEGTPEDGFVITNAHEPELINIEGIKTWDDADNQDGKRPNEIIVRLFAGETEVASKEVTADGEWKYVFTDLPRFENGEEIAYTIQEDAVEGYSTEIDEFNITNSYTPVVIEVAGTKTWVDAGDQDGKRPTEITVKLLADGEEIDAIEVTAADDWKYAFDNLPKYANGEEIVYTIDEVTVEGYETTISGFNITNSYTPEVTDITVNKVWEDVDNQDGIRPDSITVKLLANGEETDQTVELNEENNWQADFTDLDVNKAGKPIVYTVEEVAVEGYQTAITGTAEDGVVITNTHTPELINLEGTKTWDDAENQDGERPESITVRLLANGVLDKTVQVTETDEWKYAFTDLPKFANGVEITYTLQENEVPEYSTVIDGMNITNSHTPGKTSINVVKIWEDKDGKDGLRPDSITVKLLANGEETSQEKELHADNNWQADFTDLDVNKAGEPIVYTVEEVAVDEYRTNITGNSSTGFIITNTQKTYAIGDYTWIDSNKDGIQDEDEEVLPGVKVELFDEEGNKIAETVTDENGRYIFDELPAGKYKVKFTLTEEQEKEYKFTKQNAGDDTTVDSDADPETGFTKVIELNDKNDHLTKDYTDQDFKATEGIDPTWDAGVIKKTYAIGDYTWIDTNKDGIQDEDEEVLPGVKVELFDEEDNRIAETKTDENGRYIFDKLPAGNYKVKFTLTEEQAKEYKFTKQNAGDDTTVDSDADPETGFTKVIELNDKNEHLTKDYTDQDFKATEGIDPTWDAGVIKKTYAIGDYTWVDRNKDGIQDEDEEVLPGVQVELFDEEGNRIAETTTDENGRYIFDELPAGKYKVKFTLTEEQAKKYKFTKQNAGKDSTNDSDADENGWTTEITLNENNEQLTQDYANQTFKATEGIDPTWDAGVIELIDITVTKSWNDENDSIRPKSITINLLANGAVVGEYEVTAEQDWTRTITGLDKYDTAGKEIVYTITEHDVAGYQSAIDGFELTNTRADEKSITMTKTWLDDNAKDRPNSIEVELFRSIADGEKESVGTYNVTAENNWTLTIDELPTFDANGQSYTYEIAELEVDGYQSIVNGFDLTNVREGLTSVEIEKVWKGDTDQNRPEKITVDLLQNGKVFTTIELTEESDWTFTVDQLPAFDENGVAYEYTVVEHEVKGYESAITSKGNTFTITNTFIEEEIPVDPDPETPVDPDPEKPVDPKPETPKPEEPKPTNPENPTGNGDGKLPNTATNTFNYLLIGFLLLVLGGSTLFIRKRRNE